MEREEEGCLCVSRGGSTTLEHLIPVGALSGASGLLKPCLKPCLAAETLLQPGLDWPGLRGWHLAPEAN